MKFCKKCNAQLIDGSKFCTKCGNPIDNNSKTIIRIALLSILLISAVLIIIFIFQDKTPDENSNINDNNDINDTYDNDDNDTTEKDNNQDNPTKENEDQSSVLDNGVETSTNWKKYEILYNKTTITLPITYKNFNKITGYNLSDDDAKQILKPNYYATLNVYKNDKFALWIHINNNTSTDSSAENLNVVRIAQDQYAVDQGTTPLVFPGGLVVGMKITKDEMISKLGDPYDFNPYSSDNYLYETYKYVEDEDWTTTNNYVITVVNGVIDELSLDNK